MAIKAELYSYLAANAGISALVGDRIYPDVAPTSAAYPRITYTRISNGHEHHFASASGIADSRFQISCWALSSPTAESVADAVRSALDGKHHFAWNAVNVCGIFLENENDAEESPQDASEQSIFVTHLDFRIVYRESIPAF